MVSRFAEVFLTPYINGFSEQSHLLDNCLSLVYFALETSNKMDLLSEYQRFVICHSGKVQPIQDGK